MMRVSLNLSGVPWGPWHRARAVIHSMGKTGCAPAGEARRPTTTAGVIQRNGVWTHQYLYLITLARRSVMQVKTKMLQETLVLNIIHASRRRGIFKQSRKV